MSDLATLANLAEIFGFLIVVGGLFFAVLQLRQFRQQRRELAAIELFRFFGNPEFTAAYQAVLRMPDGLAAADLRAEHERLGDSMMLVSTTMDNIGVMTFQRIVPFIIVNHLIGSNVIILWRKLEHWVLALRAELGNDAAFEWFQWLAERMLDYQARNLPPAYVAHRDWVPAHLRRRFRAPPGARRRSDG